jgi:HSP20 family molecular chaperone IbpA
MLPDVLRELDYEKNTVYIEIALPGVKEEEICLKVLPEWFNLTAERENVQYRANTGFGAEIVPNKTTAEYQDGLLKIHAQIHSPLDDAKKITLD